MPTIDAGKYGYAILSAQGNTAFSDVRNGTTAAAVYNQPQFATNGTVPVQFNLGFSSKGNSATLRRSWWAFDVTTYQSGYTITELSLQFDPTTNTTTNFPIAVVKSTAQGNANTNLSTDDWNNLDFNTLYSDNSSTNYWPDTNNVSTIELNSTAVSAFSSGYLKVCIIWWFDYTGVGGITTMNGNAYANFGYTPKITFTAVASGYGNTINAVSAEPDFKLNNVGYANIDKVNDVS
jgi:hypothetical protein